MSLRCVFGYQFPNFVFLDLVYLFLRCCPSSDLTMGFYTETCHITEAKVALTAVSL